MMSTTEASNDDISKDKLGHMPDFEALARDIQNRALRRVGMAMAEARHFGEFFGTSVLIVKKTWELLKRDSLLPEGGRPKHLLWALHFMKAYPKQSPGCSAVSVAAGAVDPKTHRKWVWAFIDVNVVISLIYNVRTAWSVVVISWRRSVPVATKKMHRLPCPQRKMRELLIFFSTASSHPRHRRPPQIQIVFESRLGAHNMGNNCTMTIDGTNF